MQTNKTPKLIVNNGNKASSSSSYSSSSSFRFPSLLINSSLVVPHRILFAQNLPDQADAAMLTSLFQAYPGFQEVRTVPGKKGLAFIEFQDQIQATIALQNLNGLQLSERDTLQLTYGKQ